MPASRLQIWIHAARPRTLPLAASSSMMGSFAAGLHGYFQTGVFWLALLTTLFLQILSNLANDYGDSIHGADHSGRVGPRRAVQSGEISPHAMKMAIHFLIALTLLAGILLILVATRFKIQLISLVLLLLGVASIAAAIRYTAGRNPYGYKGFGDLSVFIFFGILGVSGTSFLHEGEFRPEVLFLSGSMGFWSVSVLNLNNMRDREGDAMAGKRTLAVILGPVRSVVYHILLIISGWIALLLYIFLFGNSSWLWITFLPLPLSAIHLLRVWKLKSGQRLDPELKKVALGTLMVVLLFGLAILWII
mgnify:CR=1 FL=1